MISRNVGLGKEWGQDFGRVNFRLFKELLAKISWDAVLKDKDVEESWLLFKDAFLRAQELSVPLNKKAGRGGRKLAWLSKDLLRQRKLHTSSGNKGVSPGKNKEMLSRLADMGSGKPRRR